MEIEKKKGRLQADIQTFAADSGQKTISNNIGDPDGICHEYS